MLTVRRAMHIRTGQGTTVSALDAWLTRHQVEVAACADVYEACVYLLKNYACIPDLVLLGADWLASQEFTVIRYVRETWPRVGVLVYGSTGETPLAECTPMTVACHSNDDLQKILAESPAHLLRRLAGEATALAPPAARPAPGPLADHDAADRLPRLRAVALEALPSEPAQRTHNRGHNPGPGSTLHVAESELPHSILTSEELSELLDRPDGG